MAHRGERKKHTILKSSHKIRPRRARIQDATETDSSLLYPRLTP